MDSKELEFDFQMKINHYDEIKQWYDYILSSDSRYVVFLEQKCYNLALIMENITDRKMIDTSEKEFLIDISFLSRCNELANFYRKFGYFPKILLCDDILIYGRNINHFLELLEKELFKILKEYDKEKIHSCLVEHTKIFVSVCSTGNKILLGAYELNLEYISKKEPIDYNCMSNKLSNFISLLNMNNNCSIFSEFIDEDTYSKIVNSSDYLHTSYCNQKAYSKIEYGKSLNKIKVIYTIRILENEKQYNVIPFVFLPNLDEIETENLKKDIFRILSKGIKWKTIEKDIEKWAEIGDNCIFNEWLNLLFNQVLLRKFNNEYDIDMQQNKKKYQEEMLKLMRNYNSFGVEDTLKILDFTLNQEVLDFEELNLILLKNISNHHIFMIGEGETELNEIQKNNIKQKIENYFYDKAFLDEKDDFELSNIAYVPSTRRSIRKVRGCCFTLEELTIGYTELEINYSIAYFLQMVSNGLATISHQASKDTKICGFSQFIKAERRALLIHVLRLYDYIALLQLIEHRTDLYSYEGSDINLENEIIAYFSTNYCDVPIDKQYEILKFIRNLLAMGQNVKDWCSNYFAFIDKEKEENALKHYIKYIKKSKEHRQQFELYVGDK